MANASKSGGVGALRRPAPRSSGATKGWIMFVSGGAFRPCDGPGSSQRDDPTSKSCRQAIPTVTCDPSTWPFALYKSGLSSGMKFTAEILDTWNMTVTPVDGVFELKKKDGYEFMDKEGRSIALPDRPYIALRLRLLQG